jgi:hypothetical protein
MGEWIAHAAAVLEAWMMGQAGGGAIADVLFGKVNPSGKLAETYPQAADTPAYLNFPGENGQVRYGEGLFIGYRYYDAKEMPVLFPFGYGLSYTTFAYSNLQVSAAASKTDGLDRLGRRDQHRRDGGQGNCAGLRPRSEVAAGTAGTKNSKASPKSRLNRARPKPSPSRSISAPSPTIDPAYGNGSPKMGSSTSW